MPVGTVECLNIAGCKSIGTYPLLTNINQKTGMTVLDSYQAKYREDLEQTIKLPRPISIKQCNMLRFNKELYWVDSVRTSTDSDSSVLIDVSYNAPSSLINKDTLLSGIFRKLPTNECPYLQQAIVSGSMEYERQYDLPKLPHNNGIQIFWVQIVSSSYVPNVATAEQALEGATPDTLTMYGFFCACRDDWIYNIRVLGQNTPGDLRYYPSLMNAITNPEVLGLTASSILDISISVRCPFDYQYDSSSGTIVLKTNGSAYTGERSFTNSFPVGAMTNPAIFYVNPLGKADPWPGVSMNVALTSMECATGAVSLRDHTQSSIASIPTAWGQNQTASVDCVSDYSGIVTRVSLNGELFVIPEGHLPFIGSAWAEYQAYSMAFDRQAIQQSVDFANQRAIWGLADSASNAITGGAVGGAIAGGPAGIAMGGLSFLTSAVGAFANIDINRREAQAKQTLTERQMRQAGGTPYNSGYGLVYVIQNLSHPANFRIDMPSNLDTATYNQYIHDWGYPAENHRYTYAKGGYFEGVLTESNWIGAGPRIDRLQDCFERGIRFIEVT